MAKKKRKSGKNTAVPAMPPFIQRVEAYLNNLYDFRYNEVTGRVEYKDKTSSGYHKLTDYRLNSISRDMLNNGINCTHSLLRSILLSDFTPVYNPFVTYFRNLIPWDGTTDYIKMLAETVKTTDDDLWNLCLRKWVVATVGCVLNDNVTNHTVIVLSGKQGEGKTTWLLKLVPWELKDYKFSGTINPNNKDSLIQLSETMLINMDELETLNRTELNSLKELITKTDIRIRRPYGHSMENIPRRASFTGSVNAREFLSDTTGNRRFLCFEALSIDYQHSIPIDRVYAQAKHLFEGGFRYWFDKNEVARINKSNEKYRTVSVEEEQLMLWMEPCKESEADAFMATSEIAEWLSKKSELKVSQAAINRLGRALNMHKFLRIKKNSVYCYAIKVKKHQDG